MYLYIYIYICIHIYNYIYRLMSMEKPQLLSWQISRLVVFQAQN